MLRSIAVWSLSSTLFFLGCDQRQELGVDGGSSSSDDSASSSKDAGPRANSTQPDRQRLFFGGQDVDNGQLHVLGLDPHTGELSPVGPAVPGASATSHRLRTVWSDWSGRRGC